MKEKLIIHRLRSGDPKALESLMDQYIPYVSAVVWNIVRDVMQKEDAEEVVSDVFLAAWYQAEQIEPDKVKAWLGAVARNKAKNKLREAGFTLPLEEDILELPGEQSPDDSFAQQEEAAQIRKALEQLGMPDREIFLRHYYYAQTVAQIAEAMDINESTVKTKLRRGRIRLKELLERWEAV